VHSPPGPLLLFAVALATALSADCSRAADEGVGIIVIKEHGVGSQALAQPYLDKFVAIAADLNGWSHAEGKYFTSRTAAEPWVDATKPHYGILGLGAFLAMRTHYDLTVIGQVMVSLAGGRQYHLVSKTATDLAGCKGKTLASDHADDVRFIDRVVAGKSFTLADFTLVPTQRPLQTIKKVIAGEAVCALIDEAQLGELAHLEGADGVHSVWHSVELPPMAVVAFGSAPTAERKKFLENLDKVCDDDGKTACGEVGIESLEAASAADYASVVAAYGK
jgi:hypothetical protein